jgi:eukaryotic-like serine/threonine-protein kinase
MHAMAGTGRVIAGRYRLKDPIGRGAMGTVWRAWDELLDREVAVKELRIRDGLTPEERSRAYERTRREARTAARLSHPGVVTVFDVAEEDGCPWIVMELVQARSLDQIISREGPLAPPRAAEVGRQLLAALATAHAAGVLHRDVKPSNVLLAEGGRAVLTDFGIATFEGDPGLTQTGMVMGSPGFTAPERIQGNPATPASDLWSLGATLFAAVEGHGPFDRAGGAITTMSAIINEEPPAAPSAAALAPVIGALLRRNPAERPGAATAARMLGGALSGGALSGGALSGGALYGGTPSGSAGSYALAGLGDARLTITDRNAGPSAPRRPGAPSPGPRVPQEPVGAPGAASTPGPPAVLSTPTSVDLPAQADETVPVKLPAARPAPSSPAPARPSSLPGLPGLPGAPGALGPPGPPSPPGPAKAASPSDAPSPAEFFAEPPQPVTPASQPSQPRQPSQPSQSRQPSQSPGPSGLAGRLVRRGPGRRALISLGVLGVVVVVAAAVMGLRAVRHPAGVDTAGQVAVESPAAAAAGPPRAGPLPAGYRMDKLPPSPIGAAGYEVGVPVTWTEVRKEYDTFFYAPGGQTYLQVDLTPHTYADMLTEARTLALRTQAEGKFPGYRPIAIRAVTLRGLSAAAWEFTWQDPAVGRMRALDLMYIAGTPAGRQSYALYMTAPEGAWKSSLATFDEEMRTFRPVP